MVGRRDLILCTTSLRLCVRAQRNYMNIYLASNMSERKNLRKIRKSIHSLGHTVTSTWLDDGKGDKYFSRKRRLEFLAVRDIRDISYADLVILETRRKTRRGGREVVWVF